LVRPLLGFSKYRLLAYLRDRSIPFLSDPSNENRAFERVRLRHSMNALAAAGITPRSLAKSSLRLAGSREALDSIAWAFLDEHFSISRLGRGSVSRRAFEALPASLALRVMSHALALVSGTYKAPRMAKLEQQLQNLSVARFGATLGGCLIVAQPGRLELYRELGRMKPEAPHFEPGSEPVWDGRFLLRLSGGAASLRVAPLGKKGWDIYMLHMREAAKPKASSIKADRLAALTTPALWRDGCLVCAPLLGFATETVRGGFPPLTAELVPALARFLKHASDASGTALSLANQPVRFM
jgi:tRNA(Ile)-lysidine synthase